MPQHTLHVVLLDTRAEQAHHVQSENLLYLTQWQVIAVGAGSLIQAGRSDLPHFFFDRFEFSQNLSKDKKLL